MPALDAPLPYDAGAGQAGTEALSALLGAGFTLGLFLAIAHFEAGPAEAETVDLMELRSMAVPLDTPPPRPTETPPLTDGGSPLAGLDIAPAESDVKIAVVPPDLDQFMPVPTAAPAANIQPAQLYTEFKPRMEIESDFSRVFQTHEVDQRPAVLARPTPFIPPAVRGNAETLRVTVLIMVDTRGAVGSVRIVNPSGNDQFDAIIVRDIREAWVFSPAVRKGRKVRCLLQQSVRVNWDGQRSPFEY